MIKRKISLLILVSVITIITVITIIKKYSPKKEETFTSTYNEVVEKITGASSTCSFNDYFKVVQAEFIVLPNENVIKHSLIFKNITGKDISFNYQVYKEQELIDKYISSLAPASPPNAVPIELHAEKRAVTSMTSGFLYPYTSFTDFEMKNIDELASKLYIEFNFDGKFDYFEVELQKVNQFSEY